MLYTTGLFHTRQTLVLASASPRRKDMLKELGLTFISEPASEEEPLPLAREAPVDYACRAALSKALAIRKNHPKAVIIGADTIVSLHDDIMGKPQNADHALSMLKKLAGHTHQVITGCAVSGPKGRKEIFSAKTHVTIAPQCAEILMAYVNTKEPLDKAGAYGIQGKGGFLVQTIQGSYSNVVGLPLHPLVTLLLQWNVITPKA